MMEIILLKDVEKLGKRGEVRNIRDGFGRNFLFPRGLALPASKENRALIEREKKRTAERRAQEKEEALKLSEKLVKIRFQLEVAAGEKDKMFGSVTTQDLAEVLKENGFAFDKKQIHLAEPIRSLGIHEFIVELDPEVKPTLKVDVLKKS